jgi:hydrogenase maturation protein HypF
MNVVRQKIVIEGIVQGVGFRPFIYQLAKRFGLAGNVFNDTRGVTIEVEGDDNRLSAFVNAIHDEKPPLASIQSCKAQQIPVLGDSDFFILQSTQDGSRRAQIPPDTFVCADCLRELFDPSDRRYRYPFINCTNCGPRYTIVRGIPYDRLLTTMANFPLCRTCLEEYENPASRRFHAQPNACPDCGPLLQLMGTEGERVDGDPLEESIARLKQGQIVAIKGLGGYHIAVDAGNEKAVLKLRRRKNRDEKPFALMAKDLSAIESFAEVHKDEAHLLQGVERPIVLLKKKDHHDLADNVAPGNNYFGVMLPYTPLHYLLLEKGFRALVMTSANLSDEPIAYEDSEAQQRLSTVADVFLGHNRRIYTRTDDSIARVIAERPLLLRRSRGYVPRGVALSKDVSQVLAVGAELKNTVCLTRGDRAFLSQHVGALKNLEVYGSFKKTIAHLQSILEVEPIVIAHDMHPDYYSSRYALEESALPTVAVQHHHAHLASCLAEHGLEEKVIGMIFDGLGYGEDGHIWGGEFLVGDLHDYERIGHFKYQQMPGGDRATIEPWRMALSYLLSINHDIPFNHPAFRGIPESELRLVAQAMAKGINSPSTSSCGRLFDAVAALLGLRQKVSFEGQAAMALEMVADPGQSIAYPFSCSQNNELIFDPSAMIAAILEDQKNGVEVPVIAGRFHYTLAVMVKSVCDKIRTRTSLAKVVLSGGVFQNGLLTTLVTTHLEDAGFEVLTHSLVPPNDGGIALGQAIVAATRTQGSILEP